MKCGTEKPIQKFFIYIYHLIDSECYQLDGGVSVVFLLIPINMSKTATVKWVLPKAL